MRDPLDGKAWNFYDWFTTAKSAMAQSQNLSNLVIFWPFKIKGFYQTEDNMKIFTLRWHMFVARFEGNKIAYLQMQ